VALSRYTGILRRLAAFIIDFLVIRCVLLVAANMLFTFLLSVLRGDAMLPSTPEANIALAWMRFGMLVCIWIAYFTVFEASRLRGTPGKMVMNIQVARTTPAPRMFPTALLRTLIKISPILLFQAYGLWMAAEYTRGNFTAGYQLMQAKDVLYETLLVYALLLYGSVFYTKRSQALHDVISKTMVIPAAGQSQMQVWKRVVRGVRFLRTACYRPPG